MPMPHPELDGLIFSMPGDSRIFWIEGGLARHIPDEPTYHGVFGSSPERIPYPFLGDITVGPDIERGTVLIRGGNEAEIYFVEQKVKRFIPTEQIKAAYQLNGNVHSIPLGVLDSLQDGPPFVEPIRPPGGFDEQDPPPTHSPTHQY